MFMNIDAKYPALARMARSQGYTLEALGRGAHFKRDKYIGLADSCDLALKDSPLWANADHHNYLATLDAFVNRLLPNNVACKKIWGKLVGASSAFLDTVVEAAWALHFWDNNVHAVIEKPFNPSYARSKDADLFVTIDGRNFWLDALNVGPNRPYLPAPKAIPRWVGLAPFEEVASKLAWRAKTKYKEKFKDAIRSGQLQRSSVGVLLCILKMEKVVLPQFLADPLMNAKMPPPAILFDEQSPFFDLVSVHTLRGNDDTNLLRPVGILEWIRPSAEGFFENR